MDAELRDYLDGKFIALERRIDDKITGLAQHVLHEMDTRFSLVDKKLDSIDSRLSSRPA